MTRRRQGLHTTVLPVAVVLASAGFHPWTLNKWFLFSEYFLDYKMDTIILAFVTFNELVMKLK